MRSLIEAGATCIRVNFSHGSHEEHLNKFKIAKKISEDMHLPVSLILDTKGPEIRVGKIKGGAQFIPANSEIKIHTTESKYKELGRRCKRAIGLIWYVKRLKRRWLCSFWWWQAFCCCN
nr:pyruvate kinase [Mycoplasmopsis bovis]